MKKISNSQLIEETTKGLNFLSQKLESKEYNDGIIGPAASSLFLTILLIHSAYKNMPTVKKELLIKKKLLINFYEFSTKTDVNDFEIIGCMRHALAHSDFSFELGYLKFNGSKWGTLKIPYANVTALTNTLFVIFNSIKAI